MDSKFNGLPPLKRFRLMQQQQHETYQHSSANKITENSSTPPSCLPAKKRKECRESPSPPPVFAAPTTLCLPAKKRIWAVHPFDLDLNLEYKPPSDEKPAQNLILSSEQVKVRAGGDSVIQQDGGADGDNEDDDGIYCAVCESTDGDPTDPIVLCDSCDLMVHASCYGHPFTKGIPEGDWFCAQCSESKSSKTPASKPKPSCCLCPVGGGALKPTTDGRWAHLVCAIYVPEVFFEDPEGREGINCSGVLKRRWEKRCCVCESKNGCVIDCSEPKCRLGFHVSCGLKEELSIEYRQGKNRGGVVAAFCRPHTDLWKKQQQTGKFKIVARDEEKNLI